MKQLNMLKLLFVASLICAVNLAGAQVHPLAFGPHTLSGSTTMSASNWYLNYVGKRVVVTTPASIAGDKINAEAEIGTGSGQWPDIHDTDLFNIPIKMDTTSDSFAGVGFAPGYFTGKIAVLWRGPIGGPFTFTLKALNAQQAGALAIVLINEYPGQPPFAPGYSASVGTITIPVYMISNTDGIAISGVYHSSPAGTVKMSLTNWGEGLTNDLGIISNGEATWHNFALPYDQFAAGSTSQAYKAVNGAFIANFGTDSAAGVKLVASTYFTPTGGGTEAVQHKDSTLMETTFIGAAHVPASHASDSTSDSVFAMFNSSAAALYNLTATGSGRFDVVYNLSCGFVDQSPGDNTVTESFYLTDSIFSKGSYDFVNGIPQRTIYEGFGGGSEFTWGPMYYVAKGGDTVSKIQYAVAANTAGPLSGSNDVYFFKWVDGSNGQAKDSIVQNGELDLVSWSTKTYGPLDTSEATLTLNSFNDSNNFHTMTLILDSNSWYYVAIDLTQSTTASPLFLGCDGIMDPFPRVFGRWWINNADLEYNSMVTTSLSDIQANPTDNNGCLPATEVSFIRVVDSFNYANEKGLIPAVAVTIKKGVPDTSHSHVGVPHVSLADNVTIYPNPANEHMDVSVNLDQVADKVTYKVLDGLGRVVGKTVHTNVQSETFSMNTLTLTAGTYFLLITADENKHVSRKFTVIH